MCNYCGDGISAHIIHEEQGEEWSPGVTAYVMVGALHVDIDADACWEYEATDNYCPMCGRKLGGDAA